MIHSIISWYLTRSLPAQRLYMLQHKQASHITQVLYQLEYLLSCPDRSCHVFHKLADCFGPSCSSRLLQFLSRDIILIAMIIIRHHTPAVPAHVSRLLPYNLYHVSSSYLRNQVLLTCNYQSSVPLDIRLRLYALTLLARNAILQSCRVDTSYVVLQGSSGIAIRRNT